jgi:hypothetical protein
MAKKLATATKEEIIRQYKRGLSAVSIAGDTRVRLDRVESVILTHDPGYAPPKLLSVWYHRYDD